MKTLSIKSIALLLFIALVTPSCMTTEVIVGDKPDKTEKHDQTKQFWLFWGLLRLGDSQPDVPEGQDMIIKEKFRFLDFVISGLTGGIITARTIIVEVEKSQ